MISNKPRAAKYGPAIVITIPVQGGIFYERSRLYAALRAVTSTAIMLIADEVQSGAGRSHVRCLRWSKWAYQDTTHLRKSTRRRFPGGRHQGARGSDEPSTTRKQLWHLPYNPIAACRALEVLKVDKEKLIVKGQRSVARLKDEIAGDSRKHPEIGDVRGLGR